MPSMTITYSVSVGTRLANELGEAHGLMDNQSPPQPRAATAAECKEFFIGRVKQFLIDREGAKLAKAAVDAAVVPAIDIT